mgnify:FL=1
MEKNEEKMFFFLDNITERCYYYGIRKKDLEDDGDFLSTLSSQMEERSSDSIEDSFAIFPTNYEHNFCYFIAYTHFIQQKENI